MIKEYIMTLRKITCSYVSIFPVVLILMMGFGAGVFAQETSSKAYQQAYAYILSEQWPEAQKAFGDFLDRFPKSNFADAAHYWQCYTRDKMGEDQESVFKCYQDFISSFPKSKWVKDAKANLVKSGYDLVKQGKQQYASIVKGLEGSDDEEVKLAALYALGDIGNEQSYEAIVKLYDQSQNENIRSKIVYVLGNFGTQNAMKKLADIASKDPDVKVKKDAVYAMGNS